MIRQILLIALLAIGMTNFCTPALAATIAVIPSAGGSYTTVASAYADASDGSAIRLLQGVTFAENLDFNVNKTVFLEGGYNPDFTVSNGTSTIRGTLLISNGTIKVKNIILQDAGTVPDPPTDVTATAGDRPNTVLVSFLAPNSSSPISGYSANSTPTGISGSGTASPITVSCPVTCAGYAFSVIATNASGDSTPSAPAEVITNYNVTELFHEPQTQPRDSIFIGSFTFNTTTGTVSNLHGLLSESMTGNPSVNPTYDYGMTWLPLTLQLSAVYDQSLGGLLVTTFKNPNTNTFTNNPVFGGTDGWSPGTGSALYYGFPTATTGTANPGNAYAMIFINISDPTAPLTQTQINKLAYADCAPGGMMGATCMTGTTAAGYGTIGTMNGYPVSQTITKQ